MASAFSHAAAALAIGACFYRPEIPKRVWVVGAICSALPDLDVIGFRFGIHYGDSWGHRGFTHSMVFASLLAALVVFTVFRNAEPTLSKSRLWLYFFLAVASHGLLDAMTDGGLGVAFFSPFDTTRYFLPWTPIHVSPISIRRFFTVRGILIFQNELLWIWLPSVVFAAAVMIFRRLARKSGLVATP
jgi:inner membrane protein